MIQLSKRAPQLLPAAAVLSFLAGCGIGWKAKEREAEQVLRAIKQRQSEEKEAPRAPARDPVEPPPVLSREECSQCNCPETSTTCTTTTTVHQRVHRRKGGAASALATLLLEEGAVRSSISDPDEVAFQLRELLPFGLPSTENLVVRPGLAVSVNAHTRNANWVAERLRRGDSRDIPSRSNYRFQEDSLVPALFRATLQHYQRSGFDRGHLVPYADVKNAACDDTRAHHTFYLSNIAPQVGKGFNRDYWARLEKFCRSQTSEWDDVFILTGPLYLPTEPEESHHSDQDEEGRAPVVPTSPDHGAHGAVASKSSVEDVGEAAPFEAAVGETKAVGDKAGPVVDTAPGPASEPPSIEDTHVSSDPASDGGTDTGAAQAPKASALSPDNATAVVPKPKRRRHRARPFVKYDVLGLPFPLAVPTHFYKVLLVRRASAAGGASAKDDCEDDKHTDQPETVSAIAVFVLPNRYIPEETPLQQFVVPVHEFERMSSLKVHPQLLGVEQADPGAVLEAQRERLLMQEDGKPRDEEEGEAHRNLTRLKGSLRELCDGEALCSLPAPGWWKRSAEPAATEAASSESNTPKNGTTPGMHATA